MLLGERRPEKKAAACIQDASAHPKVYHKYRRKAQADFCTLPAGGGRPRFPLLSLGLCPGFMVNFFQYQFPPVVIHQQGAVGFRLAGDNVAGNQGFYPLL